MGPIGNSVQLRTSLQLRQDSVTLYGFGTAEDLAAFETLITISGVGPRMALAILSTYDAESLSAIVTAGDIVSLTKVSGVGERTANRIMLELKGKLETFWSTTSANTLDNNDVYDSLTALGYSRQESRQAISSLPVNQPIDVEEKVRLALDYLSAR
tara:strand:- start:99 stop:566 length:468 start_codon:yes stop_codon:yes gene_type:complete